MRGHEGRGWHTSTGAAARTMARTGGKDGGRTHLLAEIAAMCREVSRAYGQAADRLEGREGPHAAYATAARLCRLWGRTTGGTR